MNIIERLIQVRDSATKKVAIRYADRSSAISLNLSYGELVEEVLRVSFSLKSVGVEPGSRVVIGTEDNYIYSLAFLACLYIKAIPVPIKPITNQGSLEKFVNVYKDCNPHVSILDLNTNFYLKSECDLKNALGDIMLLAPEEIQKNKRSTYLRACADVDDEIAFIQYTSRSTGLPKGVCVTHRNLIENQKMLKAAWETNESSIYVSWLPLFHDMGLIGAFLHSLYIGGELILAPSKAFAITPLSWLKMLDEHSATISGGPNFAFKRLNSKRLLSNLEKHRVDLPSVDSLYCGSEPISEGGGSTFIKNYEKFGLSEEAFLPCYGMAESTLIISDGPKGGRFKAISQYGCQVVCCGLPVGQEVKIVDVETRTEVVEGLTGEIWVNGPHVASGYWENPVATNEVFSAELSAYPRKKYLRTGDLGFLLNGELYINGRLKEVIIINGQNYYPQDIEQASTCADSMLDEFPSIAFTDIMTDDRIILLQTLPDDYLGEKKSLNETKLRMQLLDPSTGI